MKLHLLIRQRGIPDLTRCVRCGFVTWPRHGQPADHEWDYTSDPEVYARSEFKCTPTVD